MKDKDHITDAIESIQKSMDNINFIIANGISKRPIFYEDVWDQLCSIVDELESQL